MSMIINPHRFGVIAYTLKETFFTNASTWVLADNAARLAGATKVTPASSYTLRQIGMHVKRNGTGAPSLVAKIYADSTGVVSTLLATSTNTVVSATVPTSADYVLWQFTGLALTSGTPYWLGLQAASTDASNNYTATVGAFSSGVVHGSSDGITFSSALSRGWLCQTYS